VLLDELYKSLRGSRWLLFFTWPHHTSYKFCGVTFLTMVFRKLLPLVVTLLLASNVIPQVSSTTTVTTIPNTPIEQLATSQFISGSSALDGPKIEKNNVTTFDWWYFDAVSQTDNQSLVVVFFVATNQSFIGLNSATSILSAIVCGGFDDGTNLVIQVQDLPGAPGSATIVTDGNGASGDWLSTGFSFTGTSDLSAYEVVIENDTIDVHGTFSLDSVGILLMA
jgi:hypothetical protein